MLSPVRRKRSIVTPSKSDSSLSDKNQIRKTADVKTNALCEHGDEETNGSSYHQSHLCQVVCSFTKHKRVCNKPKLKTRILSRIRNQMKHKTKFKVLISRLILRPWRCRLYFPPKRRELFELHDVTSNKFHSRRICIKAITNSKVREISLQW
jgi:hypothetical protein